MGDHRTRPLDASEPTRWARRCGKWSTVEWEYCAPNLNRAPHPACVNWGKYNGIYSNSFGSTGCSWNEWRGAPHHAATDARANAHAIIATWMFGSWGSRVSTTECQWDVSTFFIDYGSTCDTTCTSLSSTLAFTSTPWSSSPSISTWTYSYAMGNDLTMALAYNEPIFTDATDAPHADSCPTNCTTDSSRCARYFSELRIMVEASDSSEGEAS